MARCGKDWQLRLAAGLVKHRELSAFSSVSARPRRRTLSELRGCREPPPPSFRPGVVLVPRVVAVGVRTPSFPSCSLTNVQPAQMRCRHLPPLPPPLQPGPDAIAPVAALGLRTDARCQACGTKAALVLAPGSK